MTLENGTKFAWWLFFISRAGIQSLLDGRKGKELHPQKIRIYMRYRLWYWMYSKITWSFSFARTRSGFQFFLRWFTFVFWIIENAMLPHPGTLVSECNHGSTTECMDHPGDQWHSPWFFCTLKSNTGMIHVIYVNIHMFWWVLVEHFPTHDLKFSQKKMHLEHPARCCESGVGSEKRFTLSGAQRIEIFGQILMTTTWPPKGSFLEGKSPYFREILGWWHIIIWPHIYYIHI